MRPQDGPTLCSLLDDLYTQVARRIQRSGIGSRVGVAAVVAPAMTDALRLTQERYRLSLADDA